MIQRRLMGPPASGGPGCRPSGTVRVAAYLLIVALALLSAAPAAAQAIGVVVKGRTTGGEMVVLGRAAPSTTEYVINPDTFDPTPGPNSIETVVGLGELPDLHRLFLADVDFLRSLEWTSELDALHVIVVTYSAVPAIDLLFQIPSLSELYIVNSYFREPPPTKIDLSNLPRLELLFIAGTPLTRVPHLSGIPDSIIYFDMSYCGLDLDRPEAQEALAAMAPIPEVNVSGNKVSLETLERYPNLFVEIEGEERTDG